MSCGSPHEVDCAEILAWMRRFLDHTLNESSSVSYHSIEQHLHECEPCLEEYGVQVEQLQQVLRAILTRCCGHEHASEQLRLRVIQTIHVVATDRDTPSR
jgi:anti-sigma factor (TIGR02949 family)